MQGLQSQYRLGALSANFLYLDYADFLYLDHAAEGKEMCGVPTNSHHVTLTLLMSLILMSLPLTPQPGSVPLPLSL